MSPHHWYLVWPSFMMTSSNGNIFRVTGPYCGEFTGPGEFPAQRPVTRSFDVFFDLHLNKRLSKQSWGWWFETTPWSLWRQCNVTARRARTRRGMLSTRVLTLLGWTAAHARWTVRRNSETGEGGSSMSRIQTQFVPKHTQWGLCLDSVLASPWPTYAVVPEKQSCHVQCGVWHCLGHTQDFIKKKTPVTQWSILLQRSIL